MRAGPICRGQDLGVVRVGDAPEQLGRPERRPVAGHRHVAQHGDHQPAALADAVDGADDRLGGLAEGVERRVVHEQQPGEVGPAVVVVAAEVAAGDEHVAGAGDEQPGQVVVEVDVVGRVPHPEVHRRGHGVAGLGAVDDAPGQRPVAFEAQVGRAQPVALGWPWARARRAVAVAGCSNHVGPSLSGRQKSDPPSTLMSAPVM